MNNEELIKKAKEITKLNKLSEYAVAGEVGSALVTDKGNVYTGVSIHAASGIGFCAESAAIASMLTNGESRIEKIVALDGDGVILPPCGRCREIIYQVNNQNKEADIILKNKVMKLKDLLPEIWQEAYSQ
jgi:cytidine deaminase